MPPLLTSCESEDSICQLTGEFENILISPVRLTSALFAKPQGFYFTEIWFSKCSERAQNINP